MTRKIQIVFALLFLGISALSAKDISFKAGRPVSYSLSSNGAQVVGAALEMFRGDVRLVLGSELRESTKPSIVISTLKEGSDDPLAARPQGFRIEERGGVLYVIGADDHGTAYGIMELSRMLGVSPWVWWADSKPEARKVWTVASGFRTEQSPAVLYRGIFINDEDSGFCPWAWKTDDPSEISGRIGPKTHEELFQLLLRLRANTFWPAMHSCSVPFYMTEGNREIAEKYGITIGTSHCEPMLANTNGEWSKRGVGEYNYITNRENVLKFWEDRVRETVDANGYYTIGMRGIHDTGMLGVSEDVAERRDALEDVIASQRQLLGKYVNKDLTKVLQALIPYKEVLPIYNAGLKVPDEVTLIWCDDNYGYIRHFPTAEEKARSGGNGLYYHFSYYGRPNATTWIDSYSPALAHEELERAYDGGIQRLWVFNVGDLKPHEYMMEYGLDLAWSSDLLHSDDYISHLKSFLTREFGEDAATNLLPAMEEYYHLVQKVRPEFLGHTRVEEYSPLYNTVTDLSWSDEEVSATLSRVVKMEAEVKAVEQTLPDALKTTLFELVGFNVYNYSAMAKKMLGAQLARHGRSDWSVSDDGDAAIPVLVQRYDGLEGGKWMEMMGYWNGSPIFKPVDKRTCDAPATPTVDAVFSASNGTCGEHSQIEKELGESGEALKIAKGENFEFDIPAIESPETMRLVFIPVHPTDGSLEVTVAINGEKYETEVFTTVSYQTTGRSEEWKRNIESNQAIRDLPLNASPQVRHVRIIANTPGVILDEVKLVK